MLTQVQKHALFVAWESWTTSNVEVEKRELCTRWLKPRYLELFGEAVHQTVYKKLCELGYLKQGGLNHSGHRRWYMIANVARVEAAIKNMLTTA